jgi:isopenicillin-N epimerase
LNTTVGVNVVARSLGRAAVESTTGSNGRREPSSRKTSLPPDSFSLRAGDEILLTDQEYGACRYVWEAEAEAAGWTFKYCRLPSPCHDADQIVDAIVAALTPKVKLAFFSHVSAATGMILPVERIIRECRARGVATVIDGAHAPGLTPVDVRAIDADVYVGNLHKWLMAPSGAAFMVVRPELKSFLHPPIVSWGWDFNPERGDDDSDWGGSYRARNLEFIGTIDRTAMMVIPETFDFRAGLTESAIDRRVRSLRTDLTTKLERIGRPPVRFADDLIGPMSIVRLGAVEPITAREAFWRQSGIEINTTVVQGETYLRISTAWFNTVDEIDRLIEFLPRFNPAG